MTRMGIGPLGAPSTIIKRKFRWKFAIQYEGKIIVPEWWCKVGARPQLDIEELEINFLNQASWLPGKARWQPLTITYIDNNQEGNDGLQGLWNLIATVYDFNGGGSGNSSTEFHQSEKAGWDSTGILMMLDGCGTIMETWELGSLWPQSVDWGGLDYSTSEEATIDVTFRYSEVTHSSNCGPSPRGTCSGCDVSSLRNNNNDNNDNANALLS